jgi:hypothetical protein
MQERFTAAEWDDLVRLPVVVYQAVAAADGRIDTGEKNSFLAYVQRTGHTNALLARIFDVLVDQGDEALETCSRENDFRSYLQGIRPILERHLNPEERRSFLAGLLYLGHNVADASGGFFGFGRRVSAAEQMRIEEIGQLLGWGQLLA